MQIRAKYVTTFVAANIFATPLHGQVVEDAGIADSAVAEGVPETLSPDTTPIVPVVTPAPEPIAIVVPPTEPVTPTTTSPSVTLEFGRGLTVEGDAGSLTIRSRVQARATLLTEHGTTTQPDIDLGVRRARIALTGHFLSHHLHYYVQLGLASLDMESDLLIPLRDAQFAWTEFRDLEIRVGLMKVPFNRQRVISSSALQFPDRSAANTEFTLDRDMGLQLYSTNLFGWDHHLGYQLGVFGGEGRNRFGDGPGLLYVARLQIQPFGRFDDAYTEVDFVRSNTPRLSFGLGFAFNHQSVRTRSTTGSFYRLGSFDEVHGEVDMILKYGGFSLQGEVLLRRATQGARAGMVNGAAATETPANGIGWYAQAGYLFDCLIEPALRVSEVFPIGAQGESSIALRREYTAGLNWYPMQHNLKLQFDWTYITGAELSGGQHQFRLQSQVYF